jgi:hypothetical protein
MEDNHVNTMKSLDGLYKQVYADVSSVTLVPKPETKSMTAQEWRERMERIKRGLE